MNELDRLIETEQALGARVAAAKAEAERIVADAKAQAAQAERDVATELEFSRARYQSELDAECRRRSDEVLVHGRSLAARFAQMSDAEVDRLADRVLQRLAEGAA